MKREKQKIIVIVGPTASGKTAFSVRLAKEIGGEIISADSRQIYRGLDIGTGKVTAEEMEGIPHHLLDIKNADENYSAAQFAKDAADAIEEITVRGHVPIIAGGTFFYIETLLCRMTLPEVPPNEALRNELEEPSAEEVFALLEAKDPRRAATIDRHNKRRVIRALEITSALGSVPEETASESPYDAYIIGIDIPREELYARIGARLRARMDDGMLEEAKQLHAAGLSYARMDALGLEYRYLAKLLQGELSGDQMIEALEREIRHFAKRQMTWLKGMDGIHWYPLVNLGAAMADACEFLEYD
jgi:tRNA dimethylallyltransferase